MNERDSEALAALLIQKGFSLASSEIDADIVLFNTCSVRDTAEQKAIGKITHLANQLKKKPNKVFLGFIGCMAQAYGNNLLTRIPELDLVVGTHQLHRIPDYLMDLISNKTNKICDTAEETDCEPNLDGHLLAESSGAQKVSAFVNIMQGCNQHCSFCIVPSTRGRERCRPIDQIVTEVSDLAKQGIKEVTLLGQIVTSYGRREFPYIDGKSPFVQLLEQINAIPEIQRIRFTAPHPKGYDQDLIDCYVRLQKLCESAHIPVQSGSNRILKLMKRGYTIERFIDIINSLKKIKPEIGLITDLIVGFPGETDQDFEDTISLVKTVQFDSVFAFKFSPRQGTPAASMPDQVPQMVKEERLARLQAVINEVATRRYSAMVGKSVEVLVEGPSRKNPSRLEGRTRCNKIVVFDPAHHQPGQIVNLKITHATATTLYSISENLTPKHQNIKLLNVT